MKKNQKRKALSEASKQQPVIAYHGTSSKFLNSILNHGVAPSPGEKVWQDDSAASSSHFSRASLEGSYWTENFMTAMSAASNATRKFPGQRMIVVAQISKKSAFADEDSITSALSRHFKNTLSNVLGVRAAHNIGYALAGFLENPSLFEEAKDLFAKQLHEELAESDKHKPNISFLSSVFETILNRNAVYQFDEDPSGFKRGFFQIVEDADWNSWSIEDYIHPNNKTYWDKEVSKALEQLTRTYTKEKYSEWNPTFRVTQTVGFRGKNKILAILILQDEKEYVWKKVYGSVPDKFRRDHENSWSKNYKILNETKNQKMKSLIESIVSGVLEEREENEEYRLNSKPFYHGTSTVFNLEPGDEILPPKQTSKLSEKGRRKNLDKVFFTQDPKSAKIYADKAKREFGGKSVVYEVIPDVPIEWLNKTPGTTVAMSPKALISNIVFKEEKIGTKGGLTYFQMGSSLSDSLYNRKNGKPSRDPGVAGLRKDNNK